MFTKNQKVRYQGLGLDMICTVEQYPATVRTPNVIGYSRDGLTAYVPDSQPWNETIDPKRVSLRRPDGGLSIVAVTKVECV